MNLPKKVTIAEVGLRDGLQNECIAVGTEQKMQLLHEILDEGIRVMEVGSFVRPDIMPQMADTGELFRRLEREQIPGVEFRALIPNYRGLHDAIESGCKNVKIGVSASRAHNMKNYNRTPEQSIAAFESIFSAAKENGVSLIGTVQMAFGSPWEGEIPLEDIVSVVRIYDQFGICKVGLGDTSSMANPKSVYRICSELHDRFPDIQFKTHFHNARGLGLCNVHAAMEAGITEFDSAFAGLGGCPFVPEAAGNIATEDLVNYMHEMGIETGIDMEKLIQTGHKVETIVRHTGNSSILRAGTAQTLYERFSNR